jgi:DNA-binding response OmpR family regulator
MSEKILIVEDEPDVADLLAYHLRQAGFAVDIAHKGAEALRLIKGRSPILIVLDLMLPGISGLDLCRLIRSDPQSDRKRHAKRLEVAY